MKAPKPEMELKDKKFLIFKIAWVIMMLGTICDYSISDNFSLGFLSVKLQLSSIVVLFYLGVFFAIVPFGETLQIFKSKFDKFNLVLLGMMLVLAYISGYLSILQKQALVHTTSRYFLYFLFLIATLAFTKYIEGSAKFIVTSFIYVNLLVVLSSLADFLIPEFNKLLAESFGHMGLRDSIMKIGGVIYLRPSGFVSDTNLTGLSIAFAMLLLLLNRRNFNKYFVYLFSILAGLSFGMLASRSALVTVSAFFVVAIALKFLHWKNVIAFILLFYAVQLITPQTQARMLQIFDNEIKEEELENGRPLVWKAGVIAMRVKPWIGIGSGVFFMQSDLFIAKVKGEIDESTFCQQINDPLYTSEGGINPHNIILTMLIEYGYAGTLLFILLMLYNIIELNKQKKYVTLMMLLGLLFVSMLSNYSPYYKYFLMIVVVSYVYPDKKINKNETPG
ncbi:MAG: O-antigen ligase family protein [Ignavibacteria bacterium]|nr:O-antigen ligase family protein [Ignavibacteria bacterium]